MTYGSSDYLRGHQTQKRCGLCEHHPILCDGRCLDCGAVNPPLFGGDLQPSESEVVAQRPLHSGLEAPVFPAWMHKPIPDEASTGAKPQINAEGSGRDESQATSNSFAGAGEVNMSTPSPLAARAEQSQPRSTARRDQTGAPGQPAPPRGRKRRETGAPPAKASKKAKITDGGAHLQITHEPLNLEALRDFASRRAADTTHLRGCAATLRECIYYFLQCVDKVHTEGLGTMTVLWREAASLENAPVRRFSGAAHFLHDDENKEHVLVQKMQRLVSRGVPEAFVGKSAFAMPKLLRYLARTGLPACDIDQNSCHFWVRKPLLGERARSDFGGRGQQDRSLSRVAP